MADSSLTAAMDAAIGWHLRLRDGDAADWEAFTAWLESDPAHAALYDEVALADGDAAVVLPGMPARPLVANDDEVASLPTRRNWLAGGGALAAALIVGVVAVPQLTGSQKYDIVTKPGEQRVVALGGQGRVTLNGSTRLTLDRRDARFAALGSGEATFEIAHDAAHPFELQLGEDRVVDVGTVFNVVSDAAGHRVEVAEGSVVYNPQHEAVPLKAGQSLFDGSKTANIVVRTRDPRAIGGWRQGRLDYQGATVTTVAADLSRSLGIPITVAPAIGERSFTGTILVDRHADRMIARLSALLDADVHRSGPGWMIGAHSRAAH